jgi:type IV pilus assembly protein PilM
VDEQSIWKKEISFRRKPKEKKEAPESTDEPTSIWKKEISFRRKKDEGAAETVSSEHVEGTVPETGTEETVWSAAPEPAAEEPAAEEPVWTRAVSMTPDPATPEPAAEQPVAEEPPAEEPVWTRAVSMTPDPAASEPAVEEPVAEEPVAEEPVAEEPVAEEPVAEEPVVEELVADKPVAEEPVVEQPVADASEHVQGTVPETGPDETVWTKEVSFSRKPEPEAAAPTPPPAPPGQSAPSETWYSRPAGEEAVPTSPQPAPAPVPQAPAPVVHPPVPKDELPPAADQKVPFWKKEIAFGGKKRDKPEKGEKAERAPKEKKPKQPKVKIERGSKGAKKLVGLKIGASQLAAARVANNGSAELLQVAREPLAPGIVVGGELRDPDALAEALKEFFAKHKLPKRGIRLGIANNRIGVRTFEIAGISDQKQLGNAIRFRAQEALPIPIDEAVLDYHVLGEGTNDEGEPTRRVLLVVAYRELIDRYVHACKKAGLGLAGIDLEAFALLRALHPPQHGVGDDPAAALVAGAIGHERSTFAVSDGRTCEFTRVLEWGGAALNVAIARVLDAAPSEVEHIKHELTLTDSTVPEGLTPEQATKVVEAMRRAVHTFARELVSSLQYYQNQPGSLGIGEIVLTGGTAHLPGLAGELESLIGVRVRVGDPLARMKVSKRVGDPEQVGSLAVAIGLGIED